MLFHTWLTFVAVNLVVSYTPGPNMLLSMSTGLLHGPRHALVTAAGLLVSMWVPMAASTAGLGVVLATSATAFQVVKWCGVGYLAWLGVKLWRAPSMMVAGDAKDAPAAPSHRSLIIQAFGVGLSNPKAIIFFTALFPQFIDPSQSFLPQMFLLAGTFSVIEFCMIMSTAAGAGTLAPWLARGDRARWINRLSGGVLVVAAILLAGVRRV